MSDMPDFDSMTPEEMMKWMESLAVRQGATEGLTTEADLEIEEVSEDDARLEGMGDYKPYGMSDEEWEKLQAKDEAEKAARLQARAAQQQSAPAPSPAPTPVAEPEPAAPEPEPVAAAPEPASAGDEMPDFDSMSPEEMMKWMESLAVRQGATEGLTTEADMQIAEVSADDSRLEGMGDYKPYGMSDEDWEKLQAKEAAQKEARLKAKQAAPAPSTPEPEPEEEEIAMADLSELGLDEPEEEIAMADLSELGLDEPEEEETEPVAAEFDFDALGLDEPEEEAVAESPMDWLSDLAGDDDVGGLDFDLDSLGELEGLGEAESAGDPMDWLQGLADDSGDDTLTGLTEMTGDAEGSLEWMESLARDQGAESEELVTSADLNIPRPEDASEDGPGYEEFSFEEGTGVVQDTDQLQAILASGSDESDDLELENPEAWLDQLAAGVAEGDDEDEAPAQWILDDDQSAEELDYNSISDDVTSKLSSGTAAPEDIEAFFTAAFQQAAKRNDVPDYIDSEDEEEVDVGAPVQAEIPDWLQESMAAAPEPEPEPEAPTPAKSTTAEMMAATLFPEDEDSIEPAEIPDWLQGGMDEDSGDISADIFAEEAEEVSPIKTTDTSDTWVQAFSAEDSPELKDWYESAVAQVEGGEIPTQAAPLSDLQAADLPVENNLPEGTPQGVPAWIGGQPVVTSGDSMEMASVGEDMDWLGTEETESVEDDMPDWLKETVDDSVAAEEDMPTWLQGEAANIEPDEIPDWLRETMDDEEDVEAMEFLSDDEPDEEAIAAVFSTSPTPLPAPMPVPVQQSPAPVPAANIDVGATLQSAQDKIKSGDIDGALLDYEQVVHANAALAQVEAAVKKLADNDKTKKHPTVHRVLGDVLMRQGKLQEALDTYRKALNLL